VTALGEPARPRGAGRAMAWRSEVDAILVAADSGTEVTGRDAFAHLTSGRYLWWHAVQEAVQHDPAWLDGSPAAQSIAYIATKVDRDQGQVVDSAAFMLGVARALAAAEAGRAAAATELLAEVADLWTKAGAETPTPPGGALLGARAFTDLPDPRARAVEAIVGRAQQLATADAAPMIALTALLLAGVRRSRHTTSVPVVFADRSGIGVAGTLQMWIVRGGPPGLFPDPQTMGVVRGDPAFWQALGTAWQAAPSVRRTRCVVWRISLDGLANVPALDGASLGAATALALADLLRYPDRRGPSTTTVRHFFHGLRPRTAVTGAIDPAGRLRPVGHLAEKFDIAHRRRWRLVAPAANQRDLGEAADPDAIRFADTVAEANRFARQWRAGRLSVAALVVLLLTGSVIAVRQYDAGVSGRAITAGRLAAASKGLLDTRIDLAQLLAATAYREDPTDQTKAALLAAVTASPHFVRAFTAPAAITTLTTSGDARTAVVATLDGGLATWSLSSGQATTVAHLTKPATMLASDTHADVIAVLTESGLLLWTATGGIHPIAVPPGLDPVLVGVSPTGRTIVVVATQGSATDLLVVDPAGAVSSPLPLDTFNAQPSAVAVPTDAQAVVFDGAYGMWERMDLSTRARLGGSEVAFGVHNAASALAADGSVFTYSNRGDALPIWLAQGTPGLGDAARTVTVGGQDPLAIALSADGSRAAAADANGTIYVSSAGTPEALTGSPSVTSALTFIGTRDDQLLSANAAQFYMWDLGQSSRIEMTASVVIDGACEGCDGPQIAISPDGRRLAAINGNGDSLGIVDLASPSAATFLRLQPLTDVLLGEPLWRTNGPQVTVLDQSDGSLELDSTSMPPPDYTTWNSAPSPLDLPDPATLVVFSPDRRTIVELDTSGAVVTRDPDTGKVERRIDGPRDMAPVADGVSTVYRRYVASAPGRIALVDQNTDTVIVTDTTTLAQTRYPSKGISGIGFIGSTLLIQRSDDVLEAWNTLGHRSATLRANANMYGLVSNNRDLIAQLGPDGVISVLDFPSGAPLGTLTVNTAAPSKATSIAVTDDGRYLVTASENWTDALQAPGLVTRWDLAATDWATVACRSAGRAVTQTEWTQYVGTGSPDISGCRR
jgi:WD40 repeat protein